MTASTLQAIEARLRDVALGYPEAVEEFPWGERVIKVNKKIFVFVNTLDATTLSVTVKLPQSGEIALMLPFVSPTGYGLGRSGWVTARFGAKDKVPEEMLRDWIDESYRALAPKKLAKALGAGKDGEAAPAAPAKAKSTASAKATAIAKPKAAAKAKPKSAAKAKPKSAAKAAAKAKPKPAAKAKPKAERSTARA